MKDILAELLKEFGVKEAVILDIDEIEDYCVDVVRLISLRHGGKGEALIAQFPINVVGTIILQAAIDTRLKVPPAVMADNLLGALSIVGKLVGIIR